MFGARCSSRVSGCDEHFNLGALAARARPRTVSEEHSLALFIERGRPERARGGHHQHFNVKRCASAQKRCMVAGWLYYILGRKVGVGWYVREWDTVGAWTGC